MMGFFTRLPVLFRCDKIIFHFPGLITISVVSPQCIQIGSNNCSYIFFDIVSLRLVSIRLFSEKQKAFWSKRKLKMERKLFGSFTHSFPCIRIPLYILYFTQKYKMCWYCGDIIKSELLTYLFNLRFRAQLNVVLAGVLEATLLFSTIEHRALQLR